MITNIDEISEPECELGYPWTQLERFMDDQQLDRLSSWLHGQTVGLCKGKSFNHTTKSFTEMCEGTAHGTVIYETDIRRFLQAKPIID